MSTLQETIRALKYDDHGLIPAVIVDKDTKAVLMVAYMNESSLLATIETGKTHFWSRSRKKYWMKGESSGHTQEVHAMYTDCDVDTVVIEVAPKGPACHDGYATCFYRRLNTTTGQWDIQGQPLFDPKDVYKK